jgi:hypothetical protein
VGLSRRAQLLALRVAQATIQTKVPYPLAKNHSMARGTSKLGVAGALGFEPRLSVLETDVLPLTLCPYPNELLHFLMLLVFPAELAELVTFQPIGIVLLVLGRRIVPLLARRASHVDDFTHLSLLRSEYPEDDEKARPARPLEGFCSILTPISR